VAELPTYRKPFRHQRCIVPATGFYEPDKIHYNKQPFPWNYFQLIDQSLFGFAGLYNIWTDRQSGKEIRSYTIITIVPNEIAERYHDRMPVILDQEREEAWLDPDMVDVERISKMLKPYPSERMKHGVSAMRRGIRRMIIQKLSNLAYLRRERRENLYFMVAHQDVAVVSSAA
jgi:putative SOS response-associated peptidase YedK